MSATPTPGPEPSPIDAATQAFEHTKAHLFPFRFERWLALGLLAFLDQCGRGGMTGSLPGPTWRGTDVPSSGGGPELPDVGAWLGENVMLVVVLAAAAMVVILAISALVMWVNSRATFAYLDDVATGRADVARPWAAHADAAWSYFGWRFVLMLALVVGGIVLIAAGAAAVFFLRDVPAAMVLALLVLIPVFLLLLVAASLLSLALRDFAAPIQLAAAVSCGDALGRVWGLARAWPLAFFLYVVLKIVFGVVQGMMLFAAACLTCCCILIPVVTQTFLQPLFHFERAWPLYLLRQMGYDLVTPTNGGPDGDA
jgi:hypothetical protein